MPLPSLDVVGKWLKALVATTAHEASTYTKDGLKASFHWAYNNIVAIIQGIDELAKDAAPYIQPAVNVFVGLFHQYGTPIADLVKRDISAVVQEQYNALDALMLANGHSTPDNATKAAGDAMVGAFASGLSSLAVTAAFEAVFPEKLNSLNGIGPMLAQTAGFEQVANAVLQPLYRAAFGRSLEYHYRSQFKPDFIPLQMASQLLARRIISIDQWQAIFAVSGIKDQYSGAILGGIYRPLQPRILATAIDDTAFDPAPLKDAMQFAGYRDKDIDQALAAFEAAALKSLRKEAISAAEANFTAGLTTDAEFESAIDSMGVSDAAKQLIQLTATQKRLKTLTEDYRKGWDAKLLAAEITADDYRVALTGLGYESPVIDGIVGGMSAKLDAAEFKEGEQEAKALRRKDQELAIAAAMTGYKKGEIDLPAVTAALTLAGLDALTIALYTALAAARGQTKAAVSKVARSEAQRLEIKAAEEEYLKGAIDADTLRQKLNAAGMDHLSIDAEIAYLDARGAKGEALS